MAYFAQNLLLHLLFLPSLSFFVVAAVNTIKLHSGGGCAHFKKRRRWRGGDYRPPLPSYLHAI